MAGEMGYLTDHRGDLRSDPRNLLPDAKSIVCVGKLYNTPQPHTRRYRRRRSAAGFRAMPGATTTTM